MTIFLDMDGVIANFFGALAKANNVKHWKSIKQKDKALADLVDLMDKKLEINLRNDFLKPEFWT